jgi:hypothetical protein
MFKLVVISFLSLAAFVTARADKGASVAGTKVDFSAQIRPILSKKCYHCHGPDEGSRKAKLRLDSFEEAIKDRKGSRAVVPGKPDESALVKRILSHDPDEVMPPPELKATLTPDETSLLQRWIAQGANYSQHWAWSKPQRSPQPAVKAKSWPKTGLDHFVLAKLEENGLKPSPAADRYTLIRRLSLDLTGLPPTPEEVDAFVNDRSKQAYERLVDRLLDSPHFGERWARVWLDLARYADSAGYGSDPLRQNIWPWRDWLIRALNRNQPFDEFTRDMLAGDLLPDATEEQKTATGFHRNTMTNTEGGTDDEEWRVAAVKDRAAVTAQVWMGLTMGCAQCHTHKFDPITHKEYYSFYAFFNQTEDFDQPDERPTMPIFSAAEQKRRTELQTSIARLEAEQQRSTPEFEKELAAWASEAAKPVEWTILQPVEAKSAHTNGATLALLSDGIVAAGGESRSRDIYTVTVKTDLRGITAFRLEALADDSLPNKGPGRAQGGGSGNFVLTDFRVRAQEGQPQRIRGRFVRVELPGKGKILSLAEVQTLSGRMNVAAKGQATQSSTDFGGAAARAIDGNTNGDYYGANSVTHTKQGDDPWWEVDLGEERTLDELVIWNRTDGAGDRLKGARLLVLDAGRKPAWESVLAEAPQTSAALALNGERLIALRNATADYSQADLLAEQAIDGDTNRSGWAVGGGVGVTHNVGFETIAPIAGEGGTTLTFTLAQNFGDQLTLGRFRLYATTQPTPVRVLPPEVQRLAAKPAGNRSPGEQAKLADFYRPFAPSKLALAKQVADMRKQLDAVRGTALPIMRDLPADKWRVTKLLNKGNFLDPGEEVSPAVPESFNRWPDNAPTNRLGLAAWLTSPENPLTARVAVNRFWGQLMGQPLVETEEDFGTQGTLPTNRELLDWLAVTFQSRTTDYASRTDNTVPSLGWDFKALLKLIVMSATYQQSSAVTPEMLERDPLNKLYSRAPRKRLDAEMVRDQALALSGLMSRRIGGPSVYPMQPDGLWRAAFNGERSWSTNEGEDRYRRGIYTFWRRTVPYPSMATFDAPSRETCTLRRQPTNTPLQAFVTMNDPTFVECAQALGRRLAQAEGSVADRVRFGLKLVRSRPPTEQEVTALVRVFEQELAGYQDRPDDARALATQPLGPLPSGLTAPETAAWTTLGNILLNLDGVLTKG